MGTVEEFRKILLEISNNAEISSIMVLACDANGFTPKDVNPILKLVTKPLFGGIFPEIIFGNEKLTKGTIIVGFSNKQDIQIIPDLSAKNIDYDDVLDKIFPQVDNYKTMFVFVDGFAQRISALIDSLFNIFGLEFNYVGGGAGSLSLQQKPCIFTSEGLLQNCAVLAMTNCQSGVGVAHGWKSIAGPFRITESDRNIIKTLDWKPAFQVYKKIVEEHSGEKFTDDNFFNIAKAYPFGIAKLGTERIIRDPLMLGEDDALICVGEVPEESFVDIMNGNLESLIAAAGDALLKAEKSYDGSLDGSGLLFIDCISRVLFLEDDFKKELEVIHKKGIPLIGVLSIGEIANSGKDFLEFYNKTAVVSILGS
jgi:hypothetical protein